MIGRTGISREEGRGFRDWRPRGWGTAAMLAGMFIGGVMAPSSDEGWSVPFAVLAALLVLVPALQYLVLRFSGARPRREIFRPTPYLTIFYLFRTVGHRFGRGTFALACAVPALVAWAILLAVVALSPEGWRAVGFVEGFAAGGSPYWLSYSVLALLKTHGTLVEELEEEGSVRFHRPRSARMEPRP